MPANLPEPQKVALAISGGGRTLQNLVAQQVGRAYRIEAVIASRADCPGLQIARNLGLPTLICSFQTADLPLTTAKLLPWLKTLGIQWIALGGFLKAFPALPGFAQKVINIHPALLPAYGGKGMYGMHVHRAVHKNAEIFSGATIHFVNEHYDEGAIISQIRIRLLGQPDPESIAAQVFAGECRLYPETLDRLCLGLLPTPNGTILNLEG